MSKEICMRHEEMLIEMGGSTFYGRRISEMDRDELLYVVGWLMRENALKQDRLISYTRSISPTRYASNG
jgi:hypothetical protein